MSYLFLETFASYFERVLACFNGEETYFTALAEILYIQKKTEIIIFLFNMDKTCLKYEVARKNGAYFSKVCLTQKIVKLIFAFLIKSLFYYFIYKKVMN